MVNVAIVEGQIFDIKWHGTNRKHFEEKGYKFSKFGDVFSVDVKDLMGSQGMLVKVTCDYCGKEKESKYAKVSKKDKHYCGTSCMYKHKQQLGILPPKEHDYNCDYCKNEFKVENYRYERLLNGTYQHLFCSKKCAQKYNSENPPENKKEKSYEKINLICECCKSEFTVNKSRENTAKFCSDNCKRNSTVKIVKCDNCECETKKTQSVIKKNKNLFCSPTCASEFKSKEGNEYRNCESCDNPFYITKASKQRFCSMGCQSVWQSEFLIGENANNFNKDLPLLDRSLNCQWCGKEHAVKSPYKFKLIEQEEIKNFCSKECYREWYAKDFSQSDEWREKSKIRAVKMLEDGLFNHTDTECQINLNNFLDSLNVEYINEYNCKYFSIDNYLPSQNLMIEVMGAYWHTDPRIYNKLEYKRQLDRIVADKRKHSYIKNQYGIEILYLWEDDINNSPDICLELIKNYINNNGSLENYHSFNYKIEQDILKLNNVIITPYSEQDISFINSITDIKDTSVNLSKKQSDKWITFNCDECGEESEQLISQYKSKENHFCSRPCAYEFAKGKPRKKQKSQPSFASV